MARKGRKFKENESFKTFEQKKTFNDKEESKDMVCFECKKQVGGSNQRGSEIDCNCKNSI